MSGFKFVSWGSWPVDEKKEYNKDFILSTQNIYVSKYCTILIDSLLMWHCDTPDEIFISSPGFWGCDKDRISSGVGLRLDILAIFGLEHTAAACRWGKIYMFMDKMPKFRPKLPQWGLSHFLTFRQDTLGIPKYKDPL